MNIAAKYQVGISAANTLIVLKGAASLYASERIVSIGLEKKRYLILKQQILF